MEAQKIKFTLDEDVYTGPIRPAAHIWKSMGNSTPVRQMKTAHIKEVIKLMEEGKVPESFAPNDKWLRIFNKELINRQ